MYDVVVKKFTFAISSPDELLLNSGVPVMSLEWMKLGTSNSVSRLILTSSGA